MSGGLNGSGDALRVAFDLVEIGVPVFVAYPDSGSATGYRLPQEWQRTDTTVARRALSDWRPGMALCAVMGHTLDLVDFDPRNGAPPPDFTAWPYAYATARTPSGGSHAFVAALRAGSRDGILPGVDVKGGRADGDGRGFAFIAPTMRKSKTDGALHPYVWTKPIDPIEVMARVEHDTSGLALAEMIRGARGVNGRVNGSRPAAAWNSPSTEVDVFRPPARSFTPSEAWAFVVPHLDALARARVGTINHALNAAAKALSHFGNEFWTHDQAIGWLMSAIAATEYDGRTWRAETTIDSAFRSAGDDWRAELRPEGARFPGAEVGNTPAVAVGRAVVPAARRIDPSPWLDGTHVAPEPSVGVVRSDSTIGGWSGHLLYASAWHTVIGPTESGKSWFAMVNIADEIRAGRTVAYAHFEESTMASTIARLLDLGVEKDHIRERFVWLDCNERWAPGEFGAALAGVWPNPSLVVLDGIIAACTRHGQEPEKVSAVGWYRETFVAPATMNGAAVLSLGHPVKGRDRADERHGFGSTAWLDEVDGVGFRLQPHPSHPIRRGASGTALLYSAKDRHGGTARHGTPDRREGWVYLGSLCVDNATDPAGSTRAWLSAPRPEEAGDQGTPDAIDVLAEAIVAVLSDRPDGGYGNQVELESLLGQKSIRFAKANVARALDQLEGTGRLERDPAPLRLAQPRGGHLIRSIQEKTDEP